MHPPAQQAGFTAEFFGGTHCLYFAVFFARSEHFSFFYTL
jgi:hypothetical protein